MSSRTARKLVAEMSDGRTIELVTSGDYHYAGAVFVMGTSTRKAHGTIVAKGWSEASVAKRTLTRYNRNLLAVRWEVVPLHEEIVWPVAEYFAERPPEDAKLPKICAVFIPGTA